MKIKIQDGLPYVAVSLIYHGQEITLQRVLLDTGSAGTIFSADKLLAVDLQLEPDDVVHRISGVGGSEFVFSKQIDRLSLGVLQVSDFEIEVGAMDYNLELEGILGMDFLLQVGANIDLDGLEIS